MPGGDLLARHKAGLDVFWLRDESLEDSENLPSPGVIAAELAESLQGIGVETGAGEGGG